jgi:A/G-specific adenine glycosylase
MTPILFQQAVLAWFDDHGRRDLPWQKNLSAYRVWVSEIMLQQTKVNTVIPYYQQFIERFPTIFDLAKAPIDEVLHYWTGLGYYARARNLHKSAQYLVSDLEGDFPSCVSDLIELPGVGRSTAGAISAIAFKQKAAILDGNVKRVLSRFSAISGWPGKTTVLKKLWSVAEAYTPRERIADYTQAMMDLGATICTRSAPKCLECPIMSDCVAYKQNKVSDYPGRKPKKNIPIKTTCFLVIHNSDGDILLERNPPSGIWGGLWVFPQCESLKEIDDACQERGLKVKKIVPQPARRHTFSHFHLDYLPVRIILDYGNQQAIKSGNHIWYNAQDSISLGMPAPIKAIIEGGLKPCNNQFLEDTLNV